MMMKQLRYQSPLLFITLIVEDYEVSSTYDTDHLMCDKQVEEEGPCEMANHLFHLTA